VIGACQGYALIGCGRVWQAANRHRVEGVVLGWREEVDVVLREWIASEGGGKGGRRWQRVGRAWSGSEPGQYLVDIRSVKLSADQSDDLCLAGPGKESIPGGFRVMDARFEGEVLRLRVAEHANPPDAYLWWQNQEPAFLIKKLREGIAGLADAGLATLLAQGNPGGMLSGAAPPRWLQGGQEHAYRACLGQGLFLVCGGRRVRGRPACCGPRSATCSRRASGCCWCPAPTSP
jgi:hypothetical protein